MEQIKICPDCATEYFSHVNTCADCGCVLLLPEEHEKVMQERQRCREETLEDQVVVKEGDLHWISELYTVLIESGIPCAAKADTACKKGCCGYTHRLLVSSRDVERARERIEEYFAEIHPEIRASQDMVSQGKCPACSGPVEAGAVQCPDCGLTLMIIE